MAWIKIAHETPDKPEIIALAEIMKIDQDAAFGKCIRMWIWADQQMVSGDDLIVTPAFLDRLTNCSGFSAALLEVGWLKGRNGRFSIPHFDRHNGQTAKNRALSADRMQRQRYAQNVTETTPEKELEKEKDQEKKKRRVKNVLAHVDPSHFPPGLPDPPNLSATLDRINPKKKTKTQLSGDWGIPPDVLAWCAEKNLPEPDFQLPMFINHFQSKGEARADWSATFRNWMLSPYRKDRIHGKDFGTGQRGTFGAAGKAGGAAADRRAAKAEGEYTEHLEL